MRRSRLVFVGNLWSTLAGIPLASVLTFSVDQGLLSAGARAIPPTAPPGQQVLAAAFALVRMSV